MPMIKKLARLFTIKTRFEASLVIYAIALGAIARGQQFLHQFPGWLGVSMFIGCLGVVFLAGAKIFDAIRPAEPAIRQGAAPVRLRHRRAPGHRPRRMRRAGDRRRGAKPATRIARP